MKYRNFSLTKFVKAAGWAAKVSPAGLDSVLGGIVESSENLLSSVNSNEDASVYQISSQIAIVQTLDFITPVVDDPYLFGQIAAANSLSDIFAMGAEVITALNIVGFDSCNFGAEILNEILRGGKSKVVECGGIITGGHTIETPEMYYGLSVTGRVEPGKFWSNNTSKAGDILILTKPLGSGVASTAIKGDFADMHQIKEATEVMGKLNFYALNALKEFEIHAATDVTGFGLLGHASEMLNARVSLKFDTSKIPFMSFVSKFKDLGLIPAGAYRNLEFVSKFTNTKPDILLADPQTSGGLLISVSQNDAHKAIQNLQNEGYEKASIIGEVVKKDEFDIYI